MLMDIHQVLEHLPQRYPFIMVDKVLSCEPGSHLIAVKNVTINEPYFNGHFPGRPVMPGVMIIEALAQASIILSFQTEGEQPSANVLHYFAGIDNARFKQVVEPGDQLQLRVDLVKARRDIWKIYGEATVDGEIACSADLMCMKKELARD